MLILDGSFVVPLFNTKLCNEWIKLKFQSLPVAFSRIYQKPQTCRILITRLFSRFLNCRCLPPLYSIWGMLIFMKNKVKATANRTFLLWRHETFFVKRKKDSKMDTSRELNKRKVARFFGPWNQWALDTPRAVNLFLNHYLRALFTFHRKINHSLTTERRCPTSGHDKPGNISRRSFSTSIMRTQRKCWHNFWVIS